MKSHRFFQCCTRQWVLLFLSKKLVRQWSTHEQQALKLNPGPQFPLHPYPVNAIPNSTNFLPNWTYRQIQETWMCIVHKNNWIDFGFRGICRFPLDPGYQFLQAHKPQELPQCKCARTPMHLEQPAQFFLDFFTWWTSVPQHFKALFWQRTTVKTAIL